MAFSEVFGQYMNELNCTLRYLSEKTGISLTQISRYKNGTITPNSSEVVSQMAKAFSEIAAEKNIKSITEEKVYADLSVYVDNDFDCEVFSANLNALIDALGITIMRMADYCNCSVSVISKVRLGYRKPRDPLYLAQNIASYVIHNYQGNTERRKVLELMGKGEALFDSEEDYKKELISWLLVKKDDSSVIKSFAGHIDTFDIDEFLRAKQLGKAQIPTVPIQLPITKEYSGVKGMEDGIISFLKATVLSKSMRDVIMYSDHPMDHCLKNREFVRQWMRGLGAILLKGIKIYIIHNVNRPFHEMMIGLESWLPMQMTGLVQPFYLEDTQSGYHHLMMVSGNASISGDAIKGYPGDGRYVFSKANTNVEKNRIRAEQLLSCAKPLVEVYRDDRAEEFERFLFEDLYSGGIIKNIFTAPPIYTISEDLLNRLLERNRVCEDDAQTIRVHVEKSRKAVKNMLSNGSIDQSISLFTEQEMREYPVSLTLNGMFYDKEVQYTYEEYMEHLKETEAFAEQYENYILEVREKKDFRNIQIHIHNDEYVVVSKNKAPTIHFVSRHPRIVEAFSNMVMVITDDGQ